MQIIAQCIYQAWMLGFVMLLIILAWVRYVGTKK